MIVLFFGAIMSLMRFKRSAAARPYGLGIKVVVDGLWLVQDFIAVLNILRACLIGAFVDQGGRLEAAVLRKLRAANWMYFLR